MKYLPIIAVLFLFACKKAEDRRCVKSAGEESSIEVQLTPFEFLDLGPHLKYVLVQDTAEKLVISGGKNLLNFVESSVVDKKLSISNGNKCNFLRSYKHEVTVEIHLKNIYNVHFMGTKGLSCEGSLNLPYLTWVIEDGAGMCDLNLNSDVVYMVISNGWGRFKLNGSAKYLKMDVRTNGRGDTYDMSVQDSIHLIHSSSELLKINMNGAAARIEIGSNGNAWFTGTPSSLEYNQYGSGELIDQN